MTLASYLETIHLDEIKHKYSALPPTVRSGLTDFFNNFMGLTLLVSERTFSTQLELMQKAEPESDSAIPTSFYWRPWFEKTETSIAYIQEMDSFLVKLNEAILKSDINTQTAKVAYEILHHYLYGK